MPYAASASSGPSPLSAASFWPLAALRLWRRSPLLASRGPSPLAAPPLWPLLADEPDHEVLVGARLASVAGVGVPDPLQDPFRGLGVPPQRERRARRRARPMDWVEAPQPLLRRRLEDEAPRHLRQHGDGAREVQDLRHGEFRLRRKVSSFGRSPATHVCV